MRAETMVIACRHRRRIRPQRSIHTNFGSWRTEAWWLVLLSSQGRLDLRNALSQKFAACQRLRGLCSSHFHVDHLGVFLLAARQTLLEERHFLVHIPVQPCLQFIPRLLAKF